MDASTQVRLAPLRRNAIANVGGRLVSAVLWVGITPVVLAHFGPERFGVWSLYFVLGGYLGTLDLGMASSISRFVAVGAARDDRRAVLDVIRRSAAVSFGLALLSSAALVLLRGLFLRAFHVPAWLGPEVERSLLVFAIVILVFSLSQVLQGALAGFQELVLQNLCFLAGLALHTALLALALARGLGLGAAVLAMLAGHLLAGGLALLWLRRSLGTLRTGRRERPPSWRELLGYGVAVQATNAFAAGQVQVGKILVGLLGRLAWVTQFELGFRVANTIWALPVLVHGAVIPASAHASEAGGTEAVRDVYRWACRWVFAIAGMALAGVWLTAAPLVTLWLGPAHPEAVAVARGLAVAFAVATVAGPATAVARGGGWPRLETAMFGGALAVNVLATLILVPRLGLMGAIWSMGLSYGVAGIGLLVVLHRRLAVPTGSWLAVTVAPRYLLPGAAAVLLFLLLGRQEPASRLAALRPLAIQGGLFAIACLATALVTGDAQAAWAQARRLGGGQRAAAPREVAE